MGNGGGAHRRGEDPVRLLAAHSEHGYTERPEQALPHEPEAVSRAEQEHQTGLARRRDTARRVVAFDATNAAVNRALDQFVASVGPDPLIAQSVRAVRRTTAALGRHVAAN